MNLKKWFILTMLFLVFYSCSKEQELKPVDAASNELLLDNGVLFFGEIPFTGVVYSMYEDESLKSEIQYLNGKKHGYEKHWYNNTFLAIDRSYKGGYKVGIHRGYWDNGNTKFVYHFNDEGAYNGSVKEWFKTGMILRDFNYVNGKESGSQQMWLENGNIRANYEVINGERFGLIGLKKCYQVTVGKAEI